MVLSLALVDASAVLARGLGPDEFGLVIYRFEKVLVPFCLQISGNPQVKKRRLQRTTRF